jgi:hypothetical protein
VAVYVQFKPAFLFWTSVFGNAVWSDEEFLPTHRQRLREGEHKMHSSLLVLKYDLHKQVSFFGPTSDASYQM